MTTTNTQTSTVETRNTRTHGAEVFRIGMGAHSQHPAQARPAFRGCITEQGRVGRQIGKPTHTHTQKREHKGKETRGTCRDLKPPALSVSESRTVCTAGTLSGTDCQNLLFAWPGENGPALRLQQLVVVVSSASVCNYCVVLTSSDASCFGHAHCAPILWCTHTTTEALSIRVPSRAKRKQRHPVPMSMFLSHNPCVWKLSIRLPSFSFDV